MCAIDSHPRNPATALPTNEKLHALIWELHNTFIAPEKTKTDLHTQKLFPASPGDNHILQKVREGDTLVQCSTAQHSTAQNTDHYCPAHTLHTYTPVSKVHHYNTVLYTAYTLGHILVWCQYGRIAHAVYFP